VPSADSGSRRATARRRGFRADSESVASFDVAAANASQSLTG
jgi:hypothetical protein